MPGYGRGYGRQRGRARGRRWIERLPETTYFRPYGPTQVPTNTVLLTVEELEALRLVDLEDLKQEEAAAMMGVSRKTLWNDLQNARKKVVAALVNGSAIHIMGGNYALRSQYTPPLSRLGRSSPVGSSYPTAEYIDNEIGKKVRRIHQLLPGTNCGMCGYPSCMECARAIAIGDAPSDACRIVDIKIGDKIKEILEEKEVK